MSARRNGKVASLPHALREEVNLRLLDKQTYAEVAAWLNVQPAAQEVLTRRWEAQPFSVNNIHEWERGGFRDWEARRTRQDELKGLSLYASRLAENGLGISGGAAAIAAGKVMELLEQVADADLSALDAGDGEEDAGSGSAAVKALRGLVASVADLRGLDLAEAKLKNDQRKADQKDRELELAQSKFQRQTVEQFLKWAGTPEAQAILESGKTKTAKMADLRTLFFGEVGA